MKKGSKYRLYVWLMILSGMVIALTQSMASWKIIRSGKDFTQVILKERKLFLVSTLRFGHGVMSHAGTKNYEGLIELALNNKSERSFLPAGGNGGNIFYPVGYPWRPKIG